MASYYVPLPAQRVDNPLLDFSPINQGLNGIAQVRQQNTENAMARERMAIAKDQHQYQRQRDVVQDARQAKQDARIDKKWHGEQAMAIMRMPEGSPERAAAWQRHLKQFNAANLSPEELDPSSGPKLYAAEAGLSVDPMDAEMQRAKLGLVRAQTAAAGQRADQTKYMEVNGRIVALPAGGGDGRVVYEAPQTAAAAYKDPKQQFDVERDLRKEYSSAAKPFFEVRDAYNRVEQSARAPSAAGDLALIFNYMKMLDPGSVVREGEFATAQNSAGVPERVRAWYNRMISGERLTDEVRSDFVGQARGLYRTQADQYRGLQQQYRGISERSGADPRNTILDYSRPAEQQALEAARDAIAKGADLAAVRKRLIDNGIDPSGL